MVKDILMRLESYQFTVSLIIRSSVQLRSMKSMKISVAVNVPISLNANTPFKEQLYRKCLVSMRLIKFGTKYLEFLCARGGNAGENLVFFVVIDTLRYIVSTSYSSISISRTSDSLIRIL